MARKFKLEIAHKLEQMRGKLDKSIAILNVPVAFHCRHKCKGCITREWDIIKKERREKLPREETKKIIGHFKEKYDTKFITVNGRGDPFYRSPEVDICSETLDRMICAAEFEMQTYVFTAGDSLDERACDMLVAHEANVMISLFGNGFIDADFFNGGDYKKRRAEIAENLRRLMMSYKYSRRQPEEGLTRLGMNYVVSERDLREPNKLIELREAANKNGIFFICNTDFHPHEDTEIQKKLQMIALENSDFSLAHSTAVDGVCQMGAGSSATISPNGELYRCPYMNEGSEGYFTEMSEEKRAEILGRYIKERNYACVLRKTKTQK